MSALLGRLRAEGRKVISLLEGEPDLPPPAAVLGATERALRGGWTRYSNASGLPDLKAAIAAKLKAKNGIAAAPENIVVTNGAKQAIYEALQALCGHGDEVVVLRPYWVTFPESVKLAGAKPIFADTRAHQLDVRAIEKAVTRRTKAVIVNTPNNPTGAVYPAAALRALARLAERRGFFIVSDEAYEDLVFGRARHVSVASLGADAARRTVTVQTFSKSYSMTGFRVGYLVADAPIARAVARLHGHVSGNVCTFAQRGALAALGTRRAEAKRRRAVYGRRRDLAHALVSRVFDCVRPDGAFFLFADARKHLGGRFPDSAALARHLLETSGVAVVPGSACGVEGYVRISFSAPEKDLREGLGRLEDALCR